MSLSEGANWRAILNLLSTHRLSAVSHGKTMDANLGQMPNQNLPRVPESPLSTLRKRALSLEDVRESPEAPQGLGPS